MYTNIYYIQDWWALGVLIYELITGTPPFNNPSGKDVCNAFDFNAGDIFSSLQCVTALLLIYASMQNSQDHIIRRIRRKEPKYPRWFSDELVDLLQGLLCKDPDLRLGAGEEDALVCGLLVAELLCVWV